MKFVPFFSLFLCITTLTGCSNLIHYYPQAPKNMRATTEEEAALKELEISASVKAKSFNKNKILARYMTISKRDGVDETEAIVIAQGEAIFRGLEKDFYLSEPKMLNTTDTHYTLEFPAINKQLATETLPGLEILVHRESGHFSIK